MTDFYDSLGDAALADDYAVRDSDEVAVFELDAGACRAIIIKHVSPPRLKLIVKSLCGLGDLFVIDVQRNDEDFIRCNRQRPDQPLFVVRRLAGGGEKAIGRGATESQGGLGEAEEKN